MTEALAQTILQMGMTNYQPLRSYAFYTQPNMVGYKLRTFPLRTLYRVLYIVCYAVYVRCGAVLGPDIMHFLLRLLK